MTPSPLNKLASINKPASLNKLTRLNKLTYLKQYDHSIVDIINWIPKVFVYPFDNPFIRYGDALAIGELFLVLRNIQPYFALVVMNHASLKTFKLYISSSDTIKVIGEFIVYTSFYNGNIVEFSFLEKAHQNQTLLTLIIIKKLVRWYDDEPHNLMAYSFLQ